AGLAVADQDAYALERHLERIRGDLGEDGAGAGADVGGGDADGERAVVLGRPVGGRTDSAGGIRGRRDPHADEPAAVAAAARLAPALPAEAHRALAQALDQVARRERVAGLLVDLGLAPDRRLHRVDLARDGQLAHQRLAR